MEFNVSPAVPIAGAPIGNLAYPQYNSTSVYFESPINSAYLTDGYFLTAPDVTLQRQSYTLLQ